MLFVKTNTPSILLLQSGLFLPILLILWGWIYWRFSKPNHSAPGNLFRHQNSIYNTITNVIRIIGSNRIGNNLILLHEIMVWNGSIQ